VVNRLNPQRAAFLACMIVLWTCGAGGQTPPLRDPSVAQKLLAPLTATDPVVREGLSTIYAVVTDTTGKPVWDLTPSNFTLLDNGRPAIIRTFHGFRAAIEPAPEVIFILDAINLSSQQLTQAEGAVVHFLQRNNGRLDSPCFVYRLTRSGLFSSLRPTRDGNLLAKR
jgi:hypothetical protein